MSIALDCDLRLRRNDARNLGNSSRAMQCNPPPTISTDQPCRLYRCREAMHEPFFKYRCNDSYYDTTNAIRKVTIIEETLGEDALPVSVTTLTVELPCVIKSAFNGKPFQIVIAESMLEMSSTYDLDSKVNVEYRPNILANVKG